MAGTIVAIEFDKASFQEEFDCHTYLRANDELAALLNSKQFRLRSTQARWLSDENRKCWSWYGLLWRPKNLNVDRPISSVVIIRQVGGPVFFDTDVPPLLPETSAKRQRAEEKRAQREYIKRIRQQEQQVIKQQKIKERRALQKEIIAKHAPKKLVRDLLQFPGSYNAGKGVMNYGRGKSKTPLVPNISHFSGKRKANLVLEQSKKLEGIRKRFCKSPESQNTGDDDSFINENKEVLPRMLVNPLIAKDEADDWLRERVSDEKTSRLGEIPNSAPVPITENQFDMDPAIETAIETRKLTNNETRVINV